ncbi:MAG: HypC/HybG/HupF family hydrogenase formation chaperone [Rubrivivax sp.]|jgi:hydrogenase expression/formation protein HypC|nr:HypC/HybG/HupF family hydrogenase formation chaperone [Rubrivivax sp.]
MCLALPARIVARHDDDQATIDLGGVRKGISLALVPEAREGDWVIVHVGHAIGLLDAEEAERTLRLFAEIAAAEAARAAQAGARP